MGRLIRYLRIAQGQRVQPASPRQLPPRAALFLALAAFQCIFPSLYVCREIKGCKKGIWGARITQSDPHSTDRVQ